MTAKKKVVPLFRFPELSTKVLLMQAIKRRIEFIQNETKLSFSQISKQSGINIAYIVYIFKRNHKILSDNVVRNIAAEFGITSLKPDFDPVIESENIARTNQVLASIHRFRIVNNMSIFMWMKKYASYRDDKFNKIALDFNPPKLPPVFAVLDKSVNTTIVMKELESPAPDSPEQRKYNYAQATKIVEEGKKIERAKKEKPVNDRFEKLLLLLKEEEKCLENKLESVKALIKMYTNQ